MALLLDDAAYPQTLPPPLKWAGGKRWLVPHLQQYWEAHKRRRLVEPFVGGLAVTLGLVPRRALLNDVNTHLINFYRWLQNGLSLTSTLVPFLNDPDSYQRNRARFNELIAHKQENTAEAAALFYYLNRTGYNGLCRFNSKGYFNVPFGRHKPARAYQANLARYKSTFEEYEFRDGDFETLAIRKDDFIYADPPYDTGPPYVKAFTTYSAGGFTWDDQVRLAHLLAGHGGPVVASNHATRRVMQLYRKLGFDVHAVPAPRRISCDGNRDDAREMIAVRNL